jgi:mRNA interferase YafQ
LSTYRLKFEPQFKKDFQLFRREYPELLSELRLVLNSLEQTGKVDAAYDLHLLDNPTLNYYQHMEFHLADGKIDVLVIYMPHKTNFTIRLVRIGSHQQLFSEPIR